MSLSGVRGASRGWVHDVALSALFIVPASWGQTQAPPRDPLEQILREQREREREPVLRPPATAVVTAPTPADLDRTDFPEEVPVEGPAFRIHTINVDRANLAGSGDVERVVGPFRGRTLAAEHIRILVARLNRLLVRQGFVTSRASLTGQNIADGELSITLVPGYIEQVLVNGVPLQSGGFKNIGLRLAMPVSAGRVLRLQDIEQAADQVNRVRGQEARVQIRPGTQAAGSVVEFAVTSGDRRQWTLLLDNQGGQDSGQHRGHLLLDQGNALGLMESLNLGLVTSRETNALFASLSLPWGYNTFNATRSWSEYQSLVGDVALVWGASHSYSLAWNRLLHRDQNSKTALDVSLNKRKSQRIINNADLSPQHQAVARLGASYLRRFDTDAGPATWTLDAGWLRGIPRWGNQQDPEGLPRSAPHARFNKLEANTSVALPLSQAWQWRSKLALQWSRVGLYSGDQIFAGGTGTVRGVRESALGGDRGFYVRNEAALAAWSAFDGRLRGEPYAFIDAARLQALADEGAWRDLATAGAGLRFAFHRATGEVMAGRTLRRPEFITGSRWRMALQLSYSF